MTVQIDTHPSSLAQPANAARASFHNASSAAARPVGLAMLRGLQQTCPSCGQGALYKSYLKVVDHCPSCGETMHHQRADDAPPYFTMFIVGHIVLAGVLAVEQTWRPSPWVHVFLWLPLVLILSLTLLPRVKGVLIGLQWALRMHGFGNPAESNLAMTADSMLDPVASPAAAGAASIAPSGGANSTVTGTASSKHRTS